ncbi:calcium-dependent protein kinase 4-like [Clytia hemisphaerica]|uniref:calcium-dependent protein kinase 4-like n=1 Tax=Clytia hemisphaerica TaxID=252671 RepID=UPI0034D5B2A1
MPYFEFSFKPFGTDLKANCLNSFLGTLHSNGFTTSLQGIQRKIARDVASAVGYLHSNNIVHRDIKPKNICVSNQHYSALSGSEAVKAFNSSPIICKLADLGEARSVCAQTEMSHLATKTKFVNRGTTFFQAPELHVEEFLITEATLDDLKKADMWALIMTLFTVINPDQRYPFQRDVKEVTKNVPKGKYLTTRPEKIVEGLLIKRSIPTSSPEYEIEQTCYHEQLRSIILHGIKYDPDERMTAAALQKMLEDNSLDKINFHQLEVSQASVLEQNDMIVAHMLAQSLQANPSIQNEKLFNNAQVSYENDGTNSCTFLSLRIIDELVSSKTEARFDIEKIRSIVSSQVSYGMSKVKVKQFHSLSKCQL